MMKMKRCLIVTGGTIDIAFAKDFLSQRSYDYVIAADAGLEVLPVINQIDLPAPQKFYTADGSSIGNFDVRPRKSLVKLFQIRNEEIPADRIACADAELTDSGGGFQ